MRNRLLNICIALFIFFSINREFSLFHFDFRYLLVLLSIVVLIFTLREDRERVQQNRESCFIRVKKLFFTSEGALLTYLIVALLSSVAWFWNGLPIKLNSFLNLTAVFVLNALMVLIVVLNRGKIRFQVVSYACIVSVCVLCISEIAAYMGISLNAFLTDDSVRIIQSGAEHFNLFGQHFRVSGFAEDPNYACFFNVLGLAMLGLNSKESWAIKGPLVFLSIVGIALSWSRTIVIGSIGVVILFLLLSRFISDKRKIIKVQLLLVVLCCLMAPIISLCFSVDALQTVLTRLQLWQRAELLFIKSPLFGNGLTAFRSFNMVEVPVWYVHCHSTFWSILSESGLVGFVPFIISLCEAIDDSTSNYYLFIMGLFALFCFNFDVTYLQISIVLIAIIPVAMRYDLLWQQTHHAREERDIT